MKYRNAGLGGAGGSGGWEQQPVGGVGDCVLWGLFAGGWGKDKYTVFISSRYREDASKTATGAGCLRLHITH